MKLAGKVENALTGTFEEECDCTAFGLKKATLKYSSWIYAHSA